jgi:hypothetical protein
MRSKKGDNVRLVDNINENIKLSIQANIKGLPLMEFR